MDVIEFLKDEHRKVQNLFVAIEQAGSDQELKQLQEQIRVDLLLHGDLEEQAFYPACSQFNELREQVERSIEEHQEVQDLLEDLEVEDDPEDREAILDELQASVEQHIREEETQLFPRVVELFDQDQLDELADRMIQLRKDIIDQAKAA